MNIPRLTVLKGELFSRSGINCDDILIRRSVTIGRKAVDSYCDFQVVDRSVSRHHLTFVRTFANDLVKGSIDEVYIWDGEINGQKSANGCRVSGQKIEIMRRLTAGDIIEIPGLVLEFLDEGGTALLNEQQTLTQ